MGIPTFFRSILQKNKNIVRGADASVPFDVLFIDYNSLIYNTWYKIRAGLPAGADPQAALIDETIRTTCEMINDVVRPRAYAYLSMDGAAPRAKMVQQRSRRYKSVQMKELFRQKRHEMGWPETNDGFDPSPNICPGTVFMEKLSAALQKAMAQDRFCCRVVMSDSSVPGEGEHKFLERLRRMHRDAATTGDAVAVYSPDADMISLCLLTHKSNISIMRMPDEKSLHESRFCNDFKYIYCGLDLVRRDFYNEMTRARPAVPVDELRVLTDYNLLLMMVGNDFIPSLPYLKIRAGGLDTMIGIYNELSGAHRHLVDYHPVHQPEPRVDERFFRAIVARLARTEEADMRKMHGLCLREAGGESAPHRARNERGMSPAELFESRFQHLSFFHPDHPHHARYAPLLDRIDYGRPGWKRRYYDYFFGCAGMDEDACRRTVTEAVINYFEAIVFTLRYYLRGCPDYAWHYRYRVSPLPSDMLTVLDRFSFSLNSISFPGAGPVEPILQLLLILPPQMRHLLPAKAREVMDLFPEAYPKTFDVDALAGFKYIYSEAILPEADADKIREAFRERASGMTTHEKQRNAISTRLLTSKAAAAPAGTVVRSVVRPRPRKPRFVG